MPLEILGPLVVVGIAGIALALHLLGLTAPLQLVSDQDARDAWLREFPDDSVEQVLLSSGGHTALVLCSSGKRGLVRCMGADTVAHKLDEATWLETDRGLDVVLNDFAAPRIGISLSKSERDQWLKFGEAR